MESFIVKQVLHSANYGLKKYYLVLLANNQEVFISEANMRLYFPIKLQEFYAKILRKDYGDFIDISTEWRLNNVIFCIESKFLWLDRERLLKKKYLWTIIMISLLSNCWQSFISNQFPTNIPQLSILIDLRNHRNWTLNSLGPFHFLDPTSNYST